MKTYHWLSFILRIQKLLILMLSVSTLFGNYVFAQPKKFTDDDAKDHIAAKVNRAKEVEGYATYLNSKQKSAAMAGRIAEDDMDGGASIGKALANNWEDSIKLIEQFLPWGECVGAKLVPGVCIDWGDCPDKTYGCVCFETWFYEWEVCPYWSYRAPVQKVESNRTYRSGYYPKEIVSSGLSPLTAIPDTLLTGDVVANLATADMARAVEAGIKVATDAGKTPAGAKLAAPNAAAMDAMLSKVDAMSLPKKYKHRSTEGINGNMSWLEYHVMPELMGHMEFRTILNGWKWHYEKEKLDPKLPFFSEGQGILAGRFAQVSELGFPDQMKFLREKSPMACTWQNVARGRTPAALLASFGGGIPGDINTCLAFNQGAWIPVTTRNSTGYTAANAALNFLKGTFTATNDKLNKAEHDEFYEYSFGGERDDRVQFLRNDRMPKGCLNSLERWVLDYGDRGSASAQENDEDPFFSAVQWRRLRTCPTDYETYGPDEWNK